MRRIVRVLWVSHHREYQGAQQLNVLEVFTILAETAHYRAALASCKIVFNHDYIVTSISAPRALKDVTCREGPAKNLCHRDHTATGFQRGLNGVHEDVVNM
ncbi:hypothetical protein NDU88_001086 [Pleurodeles waltl]|uniref:Uncharacterized protein n=1 Tax=Pleurodeles waltl TaxID=8319 RepID=A0AAV7ND79_PLEWA|nr:hypothetical protein NDU88_001086 [Pleurodeles waltl]